MTKRIHSEDGWVLMSAIALMAIMMSVGLATMSYVDTETRQSGVGRTKETAFNVAEAALNAQIFTLAQDWPGLGHATTPYLQCTQVSSGARCPSATTLTALFSSPDTAAGIAWKTSVRDNNSAATQSFYDDALTAAAPGYDANGDGKLWVRSEATTGGRTRAIVAQVRAEEVAENLPRGAVIAGRMKIDNNGNKVMIDGTAGSYPTVTVRCARTDGTCVGHPAQGAGIGGKFTAQISPPTYADNYPGGDATTTEARERLRKTAIANGTYHASCPTNPPSGAVVWIESGACSWTNNQGANSAANPGLLIINNGSLYFGGTTYFHGVLYALNPTDSTATLINLQGNTEVFGGVLVDGPGNLSVGSSKKNITLNENAFAKAKSYASAGIIQNTWREIKAK